MGDVSGHGRDLPQNRRGETQAGHHVPLRHSLWALGELSVCVYARVRAVLYAAQGRGLSKKAFDELCLGRAVLRLPDEHSVWRSESRLFPPIYSCHLPCCSWNIATFKKIFLDALGSERTFAPLRRTQQNRLDGVGDAVHAVGGLLYVDFVSSAGMTDRGSQHLCINFTCATEV